MSREKRGRNFTSENFVSLLDILLALDYYEEFEDYLASEDDEDCQDYFNEWLLSEITRIVEILSPFVALGLELQQIDLNFLKSLTLQDLNILNHYLFFGKLFNWDDNPLIIHLMEASYNLDKPIGKILKSLQKLIYLGLQIPELFIDNLDDLDDFFVTYEDFINLSEYADDLDDGCFAWVEKGKITAYFIMTRMERDISIISCIKKLQKYRFLEIKTSQKSPKKLDDMTKIDFNLLRKDFDNVDSEYIDEISLIHILRAANWIKEPFGKTIERFNNFISIGIEGVLIPENIPQSLSNYKISNDDLLLLSHDLNGEHLTCVMSVNTYDNKRK